MTLYLEQYLDHLQTLPGEVQRNLRLIRELDEKVGGAMGKLDELCYQFVTEDTKLQGAEKRRRRDEIESLLEKVKAWSDEKWQMSMQLYEMVDKHIRRLDDELARFEGELKRKLLQAKADADGMLSSAESTVSSSGLSRKKQQMETQKQTRRSKRGNESSASENAPSSKGHKKRKVNAEETETSKTVGKMMQPLSPGSLGVEQLAELSGTALIQQLVGVGAGVMDMPVDPNEPVYCTCRQVSYGEMVGCDNSDCPIEWFHFGCVGLTNKPKGKWYCPMCKEQQKKKSGSTG